MRKMFAAMLALLLFCGAAQAEFSPGGTLYVMDTANVFTAETTVYMEEKNAQLYAAYGAQIVFITMDTTYPYDIMLTAELFFEQLNDGSGELEKGILVLLSIQDEDYALLSGYELEDTMSDERLTDYANRYLEEDFAAGAYDVGSKKLFDALYDGVVNLYSGGQPMVPTEPEPTPPSDEFGWPDFMMPEATTEPIYRL